MYQTVSSDVGGVLWWGECCWTARDLLASEKSTLSAAGTARLVAVPDLAADADGGAEQPPRTESSLPIFRWFDVAQTG